MSTAKKVQTLHHPQFPDTTKQVEGADAIRDHLQAGWLERPATDVQTTTPDAAAPTTPADAGE